MWLARTSLLFFPGGYIERGVEWAVADDTRCNKDRGKYAQDDRSHSGYRSCEIQDYDDDGQNRPDDPVDCSHIFLHTASLFLLFVPAIPGRMFTDSIILRPEGCMPAL